MPEDTPAAREFCLHFRKFALERKRTSEYETSKLERARIGRKAPARIGLIKSEANLDPPIGAEQQFA